MRSKELSLYIHIPFCVRKCAYCDFLSFPAEEGLRQKYYERLCREIAEAAEDYKGRSVISIFFGGGTPSLLTGDMTLRLMDLVRDKYCLSTDAEISLEANPGTVDKDKL